MARVRPHIPHGHLADIWVAENDAALLGLGKRIPGAFRDHRALFLGQRRIDVQHEGVHVAAELRDDERDALGHQARNEVNIAAQAVELRHGDMGAELLGSTKRSGELWALVQGVGAFSGLDLNKLTSDL